MTSSYPRSLYLHGWTDLLAEVVVNDEVEEQKRRDQGYKRLTEFPHPDTFPDGVVTAGPVEPKPDRMAAARAAKAAKRGS